VTGVRRGCPVQAYFPALESQLIRRGRSDLVGQDVPADNSIGSRTFA
jgi:hypothetical protein